MWEFGQFYLQEELTCMEGNANGPQAKSSLSSVSTLHVLSDISCFIRYSAMDTWLKPQNLVMMADFPDCDVKLCDFEISRVILAGTEIREILGTPDYVPPEILHYEPITLAADMWSLGVTTYVLLTGFSPFGGETDQETFCNISRAQLDFPEELFEDVSEQAQDFIRKMLVRDPTARPTAKECLRHPWFTSQISLQTLSPQIRQDTSLIVNKATTDVGRSKVPNPNSALSQKNLRKYLSKSREALFERVVQQQMNQKNSLRKTTLLSQLNKTRLYESQMSLVSKSRERMLQADHQLMMSPSFSRSREKLYGLRSISKSHEVLDFCKTAMGNTTQPHEAIGILKTLTRATTADLSMLPFLKQKQLNAYTRSSTTSIPCSVATELTSEYSDPNKTSQSFQDDELHQTLPNVTTCELQTKEHDKKLLSDVSNSIKMAEVPSVQMLLSPKLLKDSLKNQNQQKLITNQHVSNATQDKTDASKNTQDLVLQSKTVINGFTEEVKDKLGLKNNHAIQNNDVSLSVLGSHLQNTSPEATNNGLSDVRNVIKDGSEEPNSNLVNEECTKIFDYESNPGEESAIQPDKTNENTSLEAENDKGEGEDEPRYTVAQLISAFNRHQEVITKTSLEVTMTTNDKETKIPPLPLISGAKESKFPTGANALRLFIPDIDITAAPKHKKDRRRRQNQLKLIKKQHSFDENTVTGRIDEQSTSKLEIISKDSNSFNDLVENQECLECLSNETNSLFVSSMGQKIDESNNRLNENVDSTNNNYSTDVKDITICQMVIEPTRNEHSEGRKDTECADIDESKMSSLNLSEDGSPNYVRLCSLSSESSGSRTPSDGFSSMEMTWGEMMPSTYNHNKTETHKSLPIQKNKSPGEYPNGTSSLGYNPWGKVCTGSYTRAIEKFGGVATDKSAVPEVSSRPARKSFIHVSPTENTSERTRRKSSPVIQQFL
uniref:Protein kinase domain-containing protein n=1 Tax=Timema genevievae TaxID=629358 RepID=A0A7R9JQB9_TIMGE|nr:unnamed protein product [Timema genevievae]